MKLKSILRAAMRAVATVPAALVRLRPTSFVLARLLVFAGSTVLSVGVAAIYRPAGVIVAGVALVLIGLLLVDVRAE